MAALAALAGLGLLEDAPPEAGFVLWQPLERGLRLIHAGEEIALRLRTLSADAHDIRVGRPGSRRGAWTGSGASTGSPRPGCGERAGTITVFAQYGLDFELVDPLARVGAAWGDPALVEAPMPGLVKAVHAIAGQAVAKGDRLAVLEAMKMEHSLLAASDGVVAEVLVQAGDQVSAGAALVRLEVRDMITLHHVPLARSFRVLWLLEELGLEFEIRITRSATARCAARNFWRCRPRGGCRCWSITARSGSSLRRSCSFCARPIRRPGWRPAPGDADRARYLEMLSYAETVGCLLENLNLNQVFLRPPARPSVPVVKLLNARLRAALAAMEARIEGPYLLQSGFSAADVMFAYGFELARYYVDLSQFPRLMAIGTGCARPAYGRAKARDGVQDIYAQDFYPVPEDV